MQQGIAATGRVMLSYMSRIRSDLPRLGRMVQALFQLFATLLAPYVVFISVWRTEVVRLAFGDGWDAAASVLPYVAMGSACLLLASPVTIALEAFGLLRYRAIMQIAQFVSLALGIGVATATGSSIIGFGLAWMASEIVRVVGYSMLAIRHLGIRGRLYFSGLAEPVLTASIAAAVALTFRTLPSGNGPLGMAASGLVSGVALLALLRGTHLTRTADTLSFLLRSDSWRGSKFILKRVLGREPQ